MYSLVPDRTVADRQLVRGVRATDRRRFRALRALTRFSPSLTRSTSYSAIQQALGLSGPGIAPGTAVPRRMLQRACQIMKVKERSFWGN